MKTSLSLSYIHMTLLFLFLNSCTSEEKPPLVTPVTEPCINKIERFRKKDTIKKNPLCIVLCDFTSSMDPISLEYERKWANRIFDVYFNKAEIKFYPITNNNLSPFFESDLVAIPDSSRIRKWDLFNYKNCIKEIKATMVDSLKTALFHAGNKRLKETYIVQTIETILVMMENKDPMQQTEQSLFILSDMLESGSSSFGKFNLEDHSFTEDIQLLNQQKQINLRFKKLGNNLSIWVGLYSEQTTKTQELFSFWDNLFLKIGYQKPVPISSEILFPNTYN